MFKRKTVIVIGAGGSMEYGFPSGARLRQTIIGFLEPTPLQSTPIGRAWLLSYPDGFGNIDAVAQRIRGGLMEKPSIDDYLSTRSADKPLVHLRKLAIVASIPPFRGQGPNILLFQLTPEGVTGKVSGDVELLAHVMSHHVMFGNLASVFAKVQFVTFNYDRLLEQRLLMSPHVHLDSCRD